LNLFLVLEGATASPSNKSGKATLPKPAVNCKNIFEP